MPLSKEKIEQIDKNSEKCSHDLYSHFRERDEYDACYNGYKAGATAEAEKALCLIEALEEISKRYWIDRDAARIATAALQSYNSNK